MTNPNDVVYPIGGLTAVALRGAASPTALQMKDPSFVITSIPGWMLLGLRTTGGAPEWAPTPATPEETYEEGHKFSPGDGTLQVTQNLAQTTPSVLALLRGVSYVDGVADVDIDKLVECKVYTEDKLRGKTGDKLHRHMAPRATVVALAPSRRARGSMAEWAVTITADRSDEIAGRGHYREAIIDATATPAPFINGVIPAAQKIGDTVVITGGKFTGMTGVKFAANSAVTPVLADDGTVIAKIPTGTVGTVNVTVTTANGTSNGFSYTVVV